MKVTADEIQNATPLDTMMLIRQNRIKVVQEDLVGDLRAMGKRLLEAADRLEGFKPFAR